MLVLIYSILEGENDAVTSPSKEREETMMGKELVWNESIPIHKYFAILTDCQQLQWLKSRRSQGCSNAKTTEAK
jgi:hypothetical protein